MKLKQKLIPETKISVNGSQFTVLQHIVWWQAKANETYDKYVLEDRNKNNTFRLSISLPEASIYLASLIHFDFKEPLPKHLEFNGKTYTMTQDEFCIVRKAEGKEFYKIGDAEIWWDYACDKHNGTGLSLGRNWETWEREDLATQEIFPDDIHFIV